MIFFLHLKKKNVFLGILGPPYCGIGATIHISQEMLCLPYAISGVVDRKSLVAMQWDWQIIILGLISCLLKTVPNFLDWFSRRISKWTPAKCLLTYGCCKHLRLILKNFVRMDPGLMISMMSTMSTKWAKSAQWAWWTQSAVVLMSFTYFGDKFLIRIDYYHLRWALDLFTMYPMSPVILMSGSLIHVQHFNAFFLHILRQLYIQNWFWFQMSITLVHALMFRYYFMFRHQCFS